MNWLILSIFAAFTLLGCDPIGIPDPDPDCKGDCEADYPCPPGEPLPSCTKQKACKEGCVYQDEFTAEAQGALTPTLSARWTITSQNAPGTSAECLNPSSSQWCRCGTNYTDAAVACVQQSATMIFEYPAPGGQVAAGARFSVNVSASTYANGGPMTVKLHVLKRSVVRPAIGIAGYCPGASGYPVDVASWYRYGTGAWEAPGAKGASDRSASSAPRVDAAGNVLPDTFSPHDNTVTERWDVTALLNECPASGSCFLALYLDQGAHINAFGGTSVLQYDLAGPPAVCGDGAITGAEGCDDGNALAGDGCSILCAVESGWNCSGAPSVCATVCGDGVTAGSEQCDDGNLASHDGCSATCIAEVCSCE
jgi:cysteine-rich repeat protein